MSADHIATVRNFVPGPFPQPYDEDDRQANLVHAALDALAAELEHTQRRLAAMCAAYEAATTGPAPAGTGSSENAGGDSIRHDSGASNGLMDEEDKRTGCADSTSLRPHRAR